MSDTSEVESFLRWEKDMSWPYRLGFNCLCEPRRVMASLLTVTAAAVVAYLVARETTR